MFNFQQSSSVATLTELKDSVSLKYSFDGISTDDWVPGTFMVATLDSTGAVVADANSDYYDAGYTTGTVANRTATGDINTPSSTNTGWARVDAADNTAMSGIIEYKDMTPFNPFTGTGVHGVVLAVQVKADALVESGEFVKFKIEQGTASGTAFTQSNYTEATINIKDFVGGSTNTGVAASMTGRFDSNGATPYLATDFLWDGSTITRPAPVQGTNDVIDTFNVGVSSTGYSQADWSGYYPTDAANSSIQFYVVDNFDREDILKIDFKSYKPGLSMTTVDAVSAGLKNEAYLLNALRALDGYQVNNSGVYLFQVTNSKQHPGSAADDDTGYSTYVFVDSNQNGKVDSVSTSGDGGDDLLIRLSGVAVADIQSTNFSFVV